MRTLPDPGMHNAATALGTFLAAALDHVTGTEEGCCPRCCAQCNALYFYFAGDCPAVADTAVTLALPGQEPPWLYEGGINWPYVIQCWPGGESHLASCQIR